MHNILLLFLHLSFFSLRLLSCYLLDSYFHICAYLSGHPRFSSDLQPFCRVPTGCFEKSEGDDRGNLREDIEDAEEGIDDNGIDFALTVKATTNANQEPLGLSSGSHRSGGVRQQGLSHEDPDTESEKSSEGEGKTDESDSEEGDKELSSLTSSDSDLASV